MRPSRYRAETRASQGPTAVGARATAASTRFRASSSRPASARASARSRAASGAFPRDPLDLVEPAAELGPVAAVLRLVQLALPQGLGQRHQQAWVAGDAGQALLHGVDRVGRPVVDLVEPGDRQPRLGPGPGGVGGLGVGVNGPRLVAVRRVGVAQRDQLLRRRQRASQRQLVARRLELGQRLPDPARPQADQGCQVAVFGVRLLAPDQPPVLVHVLPGLGQPVQADQDAGEPPVQLGVRPAGLDQAGAPTLDRLVGPLLLELDHSLDQVHPQLVLGGRVDRREVGAGRGRVAPLDGVLGGEHPRVGVAGGELQGLGQLVLGQGDLRLLRLGELGAVGGQLGMAHEEAEPGQPRRDRLRVRLEHLVHHLDGPRRLLAPLHVDLGQPGPAVDVAGLELLGLLELVDGVVLRRLAVRAEAAVQRRDVAEIADPLQGPGHQAVGLGGGGGVGDVGGSELEVLLGGLLRRAEQAGPEVELDQPLPRVHPRRVLRQDLRLDADRLLDGREVTGDVGEDPPLELERVDALGFPLEVGVDEAQRDLDLPLVEGLPRRVEVRRHAPAALDLLEDEEARDDHGDPDPEDDHGT